MSTTRTTSRSAGKLRWTLLASLAAAVVVTPVCLLADKGASSATKSEKPNKPNKPALVDENPLTEEQWKRLEKFMTTESPRKWEMVQKLPERPMKQRLKQGIAKRYRDLEQIKASDTERFDIEVNAIRIEDEVFGVLQELRSNRDTEKNEARLRERVGALVDNLADWKKVRLKRVEKELAALKMDKSLAALQEELRKDEANRESQMGKKRREDQIDRRIADFKQHMKGRLPGSLPGDSLPDTAPTTPVNQ